MSIYTLIDGTSKPTILAPIGHQFFLGSYHHPLNLVKWLSYNT